MSDDKSFLVFQNMEIAVIGEHIVTTIRLSDGSKVRLTANEKSIVRQMLAYRDALAYLRGISPPQIHESED